MNVAKTLDFFGGHPFIHQFLLYFGDFRRRDTLDQISEPLLENRHVSAVVKIFDDLLEGGPAFFGIRQGLTLRSGDGFT